MQLNLPYGFMAREYQTPLFRAIFYDNYRHLYAVIHRRAGKDLSCLNIVIACAVRRVGTYLYLLPQTNQARRVIWKGMTQDGRRFIDYVPKEIIRKENGTEMSIELLNGSIIIFGGSNNYNAYMGTNPVMIVYSEYPLHNPNVRGYMSPILRENKGIEIMQGTPRGKNHAYHLYRLAAQNEEWYTTTLDVTQTKRHDGSPVITQEDIEQERRLGVSEELIRQEYYCDWNVGIQGAYFTKEMDDCELQGRIFIFDVKIYGLVHTFWDIGVNDPTCITFATPNKLGGFDCIYYHESTDKGIDYYSKLLRDLKQQFGWQYGYHFAPHDIQVREWGSGARSRMSLANEYGIHFIRVPNLTKDDQIMSLRAILPKLRFHKQYCAHLVDACKEYRREFDEENRVYKPKPFHNWCSHPVDSLMYGAVAWRENFIKPEYSQQTKYNTKAFEGAQLNLNQPSGNISRTEPLVPF